MNSQFSYFFLFALVALKILLIYSQTISIENIWNDTNTGWTDADDTDDYIDGQLTTYHGWFENSYNDVYWYKTFSCNHYSTVTIDFTCNYGCQVDSSSGNEDGCYMYLYYGTGEDYITVEELYSGSSTSISESSKHSCYGWADHNNLRFSGNDFSYSSITNGLYFMPNEEFIVKFRSYVSRDDLDLKAEYIGFSFISVICNQVRTPAPTNNPTIDPTIIPTANPITIPTKDPTADPTNNPTDPSINPTSYPTDHPTKSPTEDPTKHPSRHPSTDPTTNPTASTDEPSKKPTSSPVKSAPTVNPTTNPSSVPSSGPSSSPSKHPSLNPSSDPSHMPTTKQPTKEEDFSVGVNGNGTSEMDGVTIAMIAISLFFALIFIAGVMFWYVRNKRKKDKAMADFKLKTVRSNTVTVQVINGTAVSMVMAELAPDCDIIDTRDIDGDGDTGFTFEDDEKASELQFELPENKDYVRRSIISAEDVIIIGGNETAGGMGWNEEFH